MAEVAKTDETVETIPEKEPKETKPVDKPEETKQTSVQMVVTETRKGPWVIRDIYPKHVAPVFFLVFCIAMLSVSAKTIQNTTEDKEVDLLAHHCMSGALLAFTIIPLFYGFSTEYYTVWLIIWAVTFALWLLTLIKKPAFRTRLRAFLIGSSVSNIVFCSYIIIGVFAAFISTRLLENKDDWTINGVHTNPKTLAEHIATQMRGGIKSKQS